MGKKQNRVDESTLVDAREHVLFCGVTMTGKTTLAREHAQILSKAKHQTIVYDPVLTETANGTWPEDSEILTTPTEFHDRVEQLEKDGGDPEHPVFFFVDESADIFGHSETHAHWIARRIRHCNVYLRLIVQRPKMLHPNVRTQCAYVYMMRLAKDDSRIIAADMGHGPEIANETLDKGDCILLVSGSAETERFNVFELIGVDPDAEAKPAKPRS